MEANVVLDHIPRLRRYAQVLAVDRHAADDLVQDTLERALNKLHLWRPESNMRAWLFSIMHNIFVGQWRSSRREVEFDPEAWPDVAIEASQFHRVELAEVDRALLAIPTEQREVLLLVAAEQMSYEETAKALSIPIGTVMSRLSRARQKLSQLTRRKPESTLDGKGVWVGDGAMTR